MRTHASPQSLLLRGLSRLCAPPMDVVSCRSALQRAVRSGSLGDIVLASGRIGRTSPHLTAALDFVCWVRVKHASRGWCPRVPDASFEQRLLCLRRRCDDAVSVIAVCVPDASVSAPWRADAGPLPSWRSGKGRERTRVGVTATVRATASSESAASRVPARGKDEPCRALRPWRAQRRAFRWARHDRFGFQRRWPRLGPSSDTLGSRRWPPSPRPHNHRICGPG